MRKQFITVYSIPFPASKVSIFLSIVWTHAVPHPAFTTVALRRSSSTDIRTELWKKIKYNRSQMLCDHPPMWPVRIDILNIHSSILLVAGVDFPLCQCLSCKAAMLLSKNKTNSLCSLGFIQLPQSTQSHKMGAVCVYCVRGSCIAQPETKGKRLS